MNLTETEKGYLAGFVDGEGCIGISKRIHKNKIGEWLGYSSNLYLANTNLQVMLWIKEKCEISSKIFRKISHGNRKESYGICFNKEETKRVLTEIQNFLIIKREQAKIFFEFYYNSKDKEIREACFQKMKILNKRGIFDV